MKGRRRAPRGNRSAAVKKAWLTRKRRTGRTGARVVHPKRVGVLKFRTPRKLKKFAASAFTARGNMRQTANHQKLRSRQARWNRKLAES